MKNHEDLVLCYLLGVLANCFGAIGFDMLYSNNLAAIWMVSLSIVALGFTIQRAEQVAQNLFPTKTIN